MYVFLATCISPGLWSQHKSKHANRRESTKGKADRGKSVTEEAEMSEGSEEKKKKKNAGLASKDYCMKVVEAAQLIMRDITE